MKLAIIYTLITVTYGGEVHYSRGHETLRECEQGKSLALTGMTIEQNQAADAAYKKSFEDWEKEHPWREPEDDWERKLVANGASGLFIGGGPIQLEVREGKIKEHIGSSFSPSYNSARGEDAVWVRGGWAMKTRNDVKVAECVIIPDDNK
jgi:hypothetical protein